MCFAGGIGFYMMFVAHPVAEDRILQSSLVSAAPCHHTVQCTIGTWPSWPQTDRAFCNNFRTLIASREICTFDSLCEGEGLYSDNG
jgi:hypothetical protein